jgi:hypothetical protein
MPAGQTGPKCRRDSIDRYAVIIPNVLIELGEKVKWREIRHYPIFDEK